MIFDKQLNNYLDHDHPEYLRQDDLYQLHEENGNHKRSLDELKQYVTKLTNNDSVLANDIRGVHSLMAGLQINLSDGEWDSGTFSSPNNYFLYDGGGF